MKHQEDKTYKEHLATITQEIQEITNNITASLKAGNTLDDNKKKEIESSLHKHREHVIHTYHDTMAYLKDKFAIQQDDILMHKFKSITHQAKEAGYTLKEFWHQKNA